MVYDPDQDQEVARDLRKQYLDTTKQFEGTRYERRHHVTSLNYLAHILDNQDMSTKDAAAALDKADTLFEEGMLSPAIASVNATLNAWTVRAIKEATHDSALLVHISKFGAARARAMKSGSGAFDVDDFVARLITYMGGRKPTGDIDDDDDGDGDASEHDAAGAPLDWERIARRALAKSKRVPVMDFMYVYPRSRPLRSPSVFGASHFGLRTAVVCAVENVWALDGLYARDIGGRRTQPCESRMLQTVTMAVWLFSHGRAMWLARPLMTRKQVDSPLDRLPCGLVNVSVVFYRAHIGRIFAASAPAVFLCAASHPLPTLPVYFPLACLQRTCDDGLKGC